MSKFHHGDRFRLTEEGQRFWPSYTEGVIVNEADEYGGGAGSYDPETDSHVKECYEIRLDGYDYNLIRSPDNCHHASARILEPVEASDEDVAAAIASILSGSRG